MKRLIILLLTFLMPVTFLCAQETINQSDANGHKQGKWTGKYPNGNMRYEGLFSDDKPIGEWKRFHENGKIKAQLFHFYFESGQLQIKGQYTNDESDGTWKFMDANGKI